MLVGRHRLSPAVHGRAAPRARGDDGGGLIHGESQIPGFAHADHRGDPAADRHRRDRQHGLPGRAVRMSIDDSARSQQTRMNQRRRNEPMAAKTDKPNILFIMADDIGWFNVSCYNHGIMGYRTPNIDRIAKEGAMFTDFYGQQSCTAGRAAFITGQSPIRTGLTKVGMPGATLGLRAEDPIDRAVPEELRLRHRPVRQEPSRRSQRAPADGARLRRVLRQPLSPQRRGRAGIRRLSEGPEFPEEVRPARRAEVQGDRQGRHDRRSGSSARSASR